MKPRLITIAGGSGSGKSHLAHQLQNALGDRATTLTLDYFYHDLSHIPSNLRHDVNFDHPDAIDWAAVAQTLDTWFLGEKITVPRYDFSTHTRNSESSVLTPSPLILLEGLWPLSQEAIRQASSLTIFIDCPADIRLHRRISRDTVERGRSEESVRRQFLEHVAPMHDLYVQPQHPLADLVLPHDFSHHNIQQLLKHPSLEIP